MKRLLLALLPLLLGPAAFAADPVYNTVGIAGAVSGVITQAGQSAAGTWNWNFPITAGTAGQALLSGGGGSAAMTWGSIGVVGGGTGRGSLTAHSVLLGEGTSAINQVAVMSNGQLLVGQTTADPLPKTLSGDCTLNASGVLTCTKVNSVAYPASPSTNTVPVVTGSNTITYEAVPNAALANAATTVNGTTCTLGSTCTVTASSSSISDAEIVANISGGSASPSGHTVTSVLDYVFANTAGDIILRGASNWGAAAISGDCTISSSGALTCTKTSGVSFATSATTDTTSASNISSGSLALGRIASIADSTLLVNISGGSAVPAAHTLSDFIDHALDNSQGDILYRGASGWTYLAPGTTGKFLKTQGAAADPVWATATATLSSIADGDLLANTSGGSAAPVATTTSDLLDYTLSSTQGSILYRGASGWVALGPGTSGNFLKTQGAAANPIWATAAGTTYTNGTGLGLSGNTFSLSTPVALANGGTHADLSATGGTHDVLQQSTVGGNVSVGQLACADLSDSAASCATDATNAANIGSGLLAVARGGTHLASGTSGGILAYTGTGTLASSGLLAASDPVIGGGAGVAPSSGTRSGNTTVFGTTTGTLTSGHCVQFDASGNLVDAGAACGTGSGSVGTTGSPSSGNLTKFSGSTTVTNGDLSGDVTTTSTLVTTVAKVNGVTYGTSPSTNTVPVVTGTNTVTYEAVPNAALANSSMTLAGHSVALGGTQTIACGDLSNGATGCSTATGTSGGTIPLLNGTNVWSGQQSVTPTTLAISTATFTPDGTSNNFTLTLVHASCPCTLANPSATPVAGTGGEIVVKQSATGSDTFGTWGSQYESPGGTSTLTLSTAANAVDILSYYVRDSTHIELSLQKAFSH